MFFILGTDLKVLLPNLTNFSWSYFEAEHGKGADDGIGAVCKRSADQIVAHKKDIIDMNTLVDVLRDNNGPNVV